MEKLRNFASVRFVLTLLAVEERVVLEAPSPSTHRTHRRHVTERLGLVEHGPDVFYHFPRID